MWKRAAVMLLCLLALGGCHRPLSPTRAGAPGTVVSFDNHSGTYLTWAARGVKNRVVVHLDGHSDLNWLSDAQITRIAAAPDPKALEWRPYEVDTLERHPLDIANFLYVAWKTGMARRVVWVVPDEAPTSQHLQAYRNLLSAQMHLSAAQADGLAADGNRVSGDAGGLPLTISRLEDLPDLGEPVLLDVDVDFFTTPAGFDQRVLDVPRLTPSTVFADLRERGLSWDIATVSLSVEGGFLPLEYASLGPLCESALRAYGRRDAPPPLQAALETATLTHQERLAEARQRLSTLPAVDPATSFLGALIDERGGSADPAAYLSAAQRDARYRRFMVYRGDSRRRCRDAAGALACYDAFLATYASATDHPLGQFLRGRTLEALQRDEDAIAAYRRVIAAWPDRASSYNNLGTCLARQRKTAEALQMFEAAIKRDPRLGSAYANKARALIDLAATGRPGALEEARKTLRAAHSNVPQDAESYVVEGDLDVRESHPAEARKAYAQAISLCPTSATAYARLAMLTRDQGDETEVRRLEREAERWTR